MSSVLEAFRENASMNPKRLCFGDKNKSVTYEEAWKAIVNISGVLKNKGIKRQDRIILKASPKTEYLILYYAIQLAGASVCPVDKTLKSEKLQEVAWDLDSNVIISERKISGLNKVNFTYDELMDEAVGNFECTFPESEDTVEILYTTGTTGKSKGIEMSADGNVHLAQNVVDSVKLQPDDCELVATALHHTLSVRRVCGAVYNGSSVVISDGVRYLNDFFGLMDKYNVTAITLVPAMLEQIFQKAEDKLAEYRDRIRFIQLSSAPLSENNKEKLIELLPESRLYNVYGMTESGCTLIHDFNKYRNKPNCVGRLTVNTEILFVDDNRKCIETTKDNPGWMAFKGKMNMKRYFNDPDRTAEVIDEAGVVYTNDYGYMDEDGFVYLLGRKGEVINIGGVKVSPSEIEEIANMYPDVKETACIAIKDEIVGERLMMFVVMKENCVFEKNKFMNFLGEKTESIKVPRDYKVIDRIPRTFNGKIIRNELRKMV
ncbi:MAG: acyl--CoA ligase [Lachnospiraceae bacterium]|nr:acyl--CoA ligase [Lachnospiraceae bacterium]